LLEVITTTITDIIITTDITVGAVAAPVRV
jgi:hypothetical protein